MGNAQEKKLLGSKPANLIIMLCLAVMVIATAAGIIFFRLQLARVPGRSEGIESYDRHYAFICSDFQDSFNNTVYDAAREAFAAGGDYLEFMGRNLNIRYSKYDLLKIAIDARVDGIIIESDESEEMRGLINKADEAGIPVITMGTDNTSSERKSYVGFGYYDVGQNYGKEILKKVRDEPQTVLILMRQDTDNSSQNIIFQGIKDTIDKSGSSRYFRLQTMAVSESSTFGAEESISSLIMGNEPLPDIMICLNELYTTCAAQALVEYNRVGETDVYGFYTNNTILQGIEKKIITATVTVDTRQMGRYLAEAIKEYENYGFVNEYMPADIAVITALNVDSFTGGEAFYE